MRKCGFFFFFLNGIGLEKNLPDTWRTVEAPNVNTDGIQLGQCLMEISQDIRKVCMGGNELSI